MKVELTLLIEDIDEENVTYCLKDRVCPEGLEWKKTDEYPAGPDFDLRIITDSEMKRVIQIEAGRNIVTSNKDIAEFFLNALLNLSFERQLDEADGLEHIHEGEESDSRCEDNPYDPKLIRVDTKAFAISYVELLVSSGDLDISPDFQREFVWTDITRKSRLIESLLLRIPIPVFYLSQDREGTFKVVDGMQRLTVIHSFLNNDFKLKNLEYLKELEGKWYKNPGKPTEESIPSMYARRIEQTQLYFNIIDPQAPEKVKYDIFKRINTGGKSLNSQEIRNCLSNPKTRKLLQDMVDLESFQKATRGSISSTRMADKELVLRFIAFYLLDNGLSMRKEYKGGMDVFLDETNEHLNKLAKKQLKDIFDAFDRAMKNAYSLFDNKAFRKASYINKSLFLSMSRILYEYDPDKIKSIDWGDTVLKKVEAEIENNAEYNKALSMATNDAKNVTITYNQARKLLGELLDDK